jgi:hypothetical protein
MDAFARCVFTSKVSQSFTSNVHQVLLLAAPLGGRTSTTMVLAVDPTQHYTFIRPFPSLMFSPHEGNQPLTSCALADRNLTRYLTINNFFGVIVGYRKHEPWEIYLSFWTNPNFIIAYILCFLFVCMNVGKTLDTKQTKSSQRPYFDKSNLAQAS